MITEINEGMKRLSNENTVLGKLEADNDVENAILGIRSGRQTLGSRQGSHRAEVDKQSVPWCLGNQPCSPSFFHLLWGGQKVDVDFEQGFRAR